MVLLDVTGDENGQAVRLFGEESDGSISDPAFSVGRQTSSSNITQESTGATETGPSSSSEPSVVSDEPLDRLTAPDELPSSAILAVSVDPTDGGVAVGLRNGASILYGPDGRQKRAFKCNNNLPVTALTFTPDGRSLLSAGADSEVCLSNKNDGRKLRAFRGSEFPLRALAVSKNGQLVAAGSDATTVHIWTASDGKLVMVLRGHRDSVNAVAFSNNNRTLASGSADNLVKLWDVRTGEELVTLRGHADDVTAVAFARNGQKVVSASKDGTVRVWDSGTGRQLLVFRVPEEKIGALAISPNGNTVSAVSNNGRIYSWEVEGGMLISTTPVAGRHVRGLAYASDGSVISADEGGRIERVDIVAGTTEEFADTARSPDSGASR
jgi:WD40 repeat protein